MPRTFHIGVDENGLGAHLGPLVVTAVLAEVDEPGRRALAHPLPPTLRKDLDDSKRLMSHQSWALGEAWARVVIGEGVDTPDVLLARLALDSQVTLRQLCPPQALPQCWGSANLTFQADVPTIARIRRHVRTLETRGIRLSTARSAIICTKRLNDARAQGRNRFVTDLHAMETLLLTLREGTPSDVEATCGKVGSMTDYASFFGPLAGRLHVEVERGAQRSTYQFPEIGRVSFLRDADAHNPLVMLASLIGKYVRELLMSKITRHYAVDDPRIATPSGYHDKLSDGFVNATALTRKEQRIPTDCFQRLRNPKKESY